MAQEKEEKLKLANWNLPPEIVARYAKQGVTTMFPWQVGVMSTGHPFSVAYCHARIDLFHVIVALLA